MRIYCCDGVDKCTEPYVAGCVVHVEGHDVVQLHMDSANSVDELIDRVNNLLVRDICFECNDEVTKVVILFELVRFTDGIGTFLTDVIIAG